LSRPLVALTLVAMAWPIGAAELSIDLRRALALAHAALDGTAAFSIAESRRYGAEVLSRISRVPRDEREHLVTHVEQLRWLLELLDTRLLMLVELDRAPH
jgi:hypothetical protein